MQRTRHTDEVGGAGQDLFSVAEDGLDHGHVDFTQMHIKAVCGADSGYPLKIVLDTKAFLSYNSNGHFNRALEN